MGGVVYEVNIVMKVISYFELLEWNGILLLSSYFVSGIIRKDQYNFIMDHVKISINRETKERLEQLKSEYDVSYDVAIDKLITFYQRIAPIIEEIEQVDNEEEAVCT